MLRDRTGRLFRAKVLSPAFYALNDARTPMLISVASVALNFLTILLMLTVAHLGHEGLALSTSIVAIVSSVVLLVMMRNRIGGIYGRKLWQTFVRVSAASALMGAAVWITSRSVSVVVGTSKIGRLTDLAISIPAGLMVLYGMCKMLEIKELDIAMNSVAGTLQRRLRFPRARISKQ